MPPRRLMRSFLFLWLATGVALLYGSVETVRSAFGSSAHVNPHLVVLGSVEAVAAGLFLIPQWMRFGAIGLLITILVALAVHTVLREFRGDLMLYAAAVSFVLIHGPLTREQLRVTMSARAA
jgi:uncharacterized membrane protein YphA (DoxX/SURF4 family)